jgi:GNAT superfamily N-acetyltransferase
VAHGMVPSEVVPGRLSRWRDALERDFVHYRLVILRHTYETAPRPPAGLRVREHVDMAVGAARLYRAFGRRLPLARFDERRRHGLRLFELCEGDRTLAGTWVVPSGERFVDELALGFPVGPRDLWLRDIFVAPGARGRGVFASLLDAVVALEFPQTRTLWSLVTKDNRASLLAHRRYGHQSFAEYEVLHLFRRLLWRRRWPLGPWPGSSFAFPRRLLHTGADYWRFVDEHRA